MNKTKTIKSFKPYFFSISVYTNRENAVQFLIEYFNSIWDELKTSKENYWADFIFSNFRGHHLLLTFYSNDKIVLEKIKPPICQVVEKFLKQNPCKPGNNPFKIDKEIMDFPINSAEYSKIQRHKKSTFISRGESIEFIDLMLTLFKEEDSKEDGFIEYWCIQLFILILIVGLKSNKSCSKFLDGYYSKLASKYIDNEKAVKYMGNKSNKILLNVQKNLKEYIEMSRDSIEMNTSLGELNNWILYPIIIIR